MEAVSFIVPGPRHCHSLTFSWEGVSNHFGALQCLSDAMVKYIYIIKGKLVAIQENDCALIMLLV